MNKICNLKKQLRQITKRNIIGFIALFAIGLALLLGIGWGYEGVFFWLFFLSLFYWKIDSRVSIGMALGGLVAIMLLLALHGFEIAPKIPWGGKLFTMHLDTLAEKVAVWVYFFLVIGVVRQVWEYRVETQAKDRKFAEESE